MSRFLRITCRGSVNVGIGTRMPETNANPREPQKSIAPCVVSTWSFSAIGAAACAESLSKGSTALDAVVDGVTTVELDPSVTSVGFGGLPNKDGKLELDAALMTGDGRVGAVAALPGCKASAPVARAVLHHCRHTMLAGEGAAAFARLHQLGDDGNGDLLSPHARRRFEEYCAAHGSTDACQDKPRTGGDAEARLHTDTVGMICRDKDGAIAACCATSGMEFKDAGRVGDAPVVGAGVYADETVGAAVASGEGDKMMRYCMSFLVVEEMRRGATPSSACESAVKRVRSADPGCQAAVCAMDARTGEVGASCTRDGFKIAVWDGGTDHALSIVAVQGVPPCEPWRHTCV